MQYWSACITQAQEPNPLSSRDGQRLKPVPKQWKLTQLALTQNLQEAMQKMHSMQLGLLLTAWGSSKQPDKASLALMRGFAYEQAGRHGQALKVSKQLVTPSKPPAPSLSHTIAPTQDKCTAPSVPSKKWDSQPCWQSVLLAHCKVWNTALCMLCVHNQAKQVWVEQISFTAGCQSGAGVCSQGQQPAKHLQLVLGAWVALCSFRRLAGSTLAWTDSTNLLLRHCCQSANSFRAA